MRIAAAIVVAAVILFHGAAVPRAQAILAIDKRITYILPQWLDFLTASPQTVAEQVADLRTRIGGGSDSPRVRTGFTTYINVSMNAVDPSDIAGIQAALASTVFRCFVTDHAVGGYILDTTTLTNGLHSIAWIVRDNTGATQGVGSRFFTVANP